MKLIKQINVICIFGFLMVFGAVSCTNAQSTEAVDAEVASVPILNSTEPPVEYGASLEEWNLALSDDSVQSVTSDSTSPQSTLENEAENATEIPDAEEVTAVSPTADSTLSSDGIYQEIMWDALVPPEFSSEVIMAKYEDELAQFEDGSPEAYDLYTQMQEEFNNAPVNEALSGALVKLPGFITPLDYSDELITEFLLVPYFGACIHVPPPPVNQTVLVSTSNENGIQLQDTFNPVWIVGKLVTEQATTDLAEAGYVMQDAIIEPYIIP